MAKQTYLTPEMRLFLGCIRLSDTNGIEAAYRRKLVQRGDDTDGIEVQTENRIKELFDAVHGR
jgi:hypothetical protein